ncbi:hypothetical protein NBO_429g0003 [Nosema bombycis CQ1]|uniref:Uncharacterized protein n=1 Tax=Nosema bombycis (strain CQ1 / CVCC 102059) TaxID=578461 RepID=R0KQK1_NOSB1|nr:hypothetical protein NBO_429g0003 [Nosema bombycis CQ1]|eukprot:EOB12482.1 hypothetical protein NBO_429g0003 [Nosema bombycis CQ1]
MKIFKIFFVLNVVYTFDPFLINEVLVLENNYWGEDNAQLETKEGFLNAVIVEINNGEKQDLWENLIIPSDCYYDSEKIKHLFVLFTNLTEKILSKANADNEDQTLVLNFQYFYSDTKLENAFSMVDYKGKLYFYENYKVLNYESDDTIKFKEDTSKSCICHVKQMTQNLFNSKYVVLVDSDTDFIDQNMNVTLCYFSSQKSCFENFKKFVQFLNCLKLAKDDTDPISQNNSIVDENNLLEMSFFDSYLENKFNIDYKNKKDAKIHRFIDMIESLFEQCCYEIKEKLSNHQIILPVNGIVTIEFILDQFYELIKKAIESSLKNIGSEYSVKVPVIFCAYFLVFKRDIKRMSKSIINSTWESLRIFDYFNELLGREIANEEDYMEVDKAICDYFNIMRCINEAKYDQSRTSVINLANPMLKDKFECRLIKAFEITVENPIEFGSIKAIGLKGKEILIEESVDYFMRFYEQ